MITSSLPPELKVMIASGFLLAGGLLALRYPADRESETPATTAAVVVGRNVLPSSSPTLQEQASIASPSGAGSSFEPIEAFVRRTDRRDDMPTHAGSGDWYPTSMSEPNDSANGGMSHNDAETRTLDRRTYAAMPVDSTLEQTVPPMPEYRPFLVASPVTMPEANPAFFAEPPTPPNLTGLAKTSDIFGEAVPGHIISPSATTQPSVPVTGVSPREPSGSSPATASPLASSPLAPTTLSRPVTPRSEISDMRELSGQHGVAPLASPAEQPRGVVLTAPARTVIVPNRSAL